VDWTSWPQNSWSHPAGNALLCHPPRMPEPPCGGGLVSGTLVTVRLNHVPGTFRLSSHSSKQIGPWLDAAPGPALSQEIGEVRGALAAEARQWSGRRNALRARPQAAYLAPQQRDAGVSIWGLVCRRPRKGRHEAADTPQSWICSENGQALGLIPLSFLFFGFFGFFLNNLIFLEQFWFTEKLTRKYRESHGASPLPSCFPVTTILHGVGICHGWQANTVN
jgi:hypothetical protein